MLRNTKGESVPVTRGVLKLGFWVALVSFLAAVGYDIAQVLAALSALSFPWDGVLIYSTSLFIAAPFLIALLVLHHTTAEPMRFWSLAGVVFATIYTTYVTLNYVVQLATVIPAYFQGALAQVSIIDQTPHSLFWDVDALGYIFMGLATLFASQTFPKEGPAKWARRFFLANGFVTPLIMVVYFYPVFSTALLIIGLPWGITAPGSILLLALFFRRNSG